MVNKKKSKDNKIKNAIFGLITLGIVVISCIILIELFFYLLPGLVPESIEHLARGRIYNYHPEMFATLKPDFKKEFFLPVINTSINVTTREFGNDGIGYRDPRTTELDAKNKILVLGDSFTFGYGVNDDETFPYYLDQIFKENSQDVDVINGGIVGYSGVLEYLHYKLYSKNLKPSVVIVALWSNDFYDNYAYENARFIKTRAFLGRHSVIYNLLGAMQSMLKHKSDSKDSENTSIKEITYDSLPEDIKIGYELERESLLKLAQLTKEEGSILVLVALPGMKDVFLDKIVTDEDKKDIIVIDLMDEGDNIPDLIGNYHGHYTPTSAKVIAWLIYDYMMRNPSIMASIE